WLSSFSDLMILDEDIVPSAAGQYDLAFFFHLADDLDNLRLGLFNIRQTHWTHDLQVFLDHLGGTTGDVLENLILDFIRRGFHGQRECIVADFAHDGLDAAIIQMEYVLEG